MTKTTTKAAAATWFLRNSSGSLLVAGADGTVGRVDCYPAAVDFFDEHGEGFGL